MANSKSKGGGPHNFRGGSTHHAIKDANRRVCEENIAEFQKLTPAQQVQALDLRLGEGVGAVKQRARLAKVLAEKKS